MSSTLIDSPGAEAIASATPGIDAHPHPPIQRTWLVAAALMTAVTLGLTVAWQTATGSSASATPASTSPAAQAAPADAAASVGAGLLSLAWELTPPSQRDAACAQFAASPAAAWAAYSSAAQDVATRAEFTAFFTAAC
jgi:hypothetical protein